MRVILGADHGGFEMKEKIKAWLNEKGFEVEDVGAYSLIPGDDFVDYAKAAIKVTIPTRDKLILFCRNGFGMMVAANRFVGLRCGLAFDQEAVRKGRTDDDINALAIPTDYRDETEVRRTIEIFLKTDFEKDEKYIRRINKLDNLF